MANRTLTAQILLKNDTAVNFTTANPVLGKGELGVEIDTRKFKFGDGISEWGELKYANAGNIEVKSTSPTTSDIDYDLGTFWINTVSSKVFVMFGKTLESATWIEVPTASGTVEKANKLATARNITITGAVVENTKSFDGSENISFSLVLNDSGITAGTYTKITFNAKGLAISGTTLEATDIPNLTLSKITDAKTAAGYDVGTTSGTIPVLGEDGKIDSARLPSIAITDTHVVESQAAMLALTAQKGDIAIRSDTSNVYILSAEPASELANWILFPTPASAVLSVNGKTGAVTLTTDDISEGTTNKYYTEERATTNFGTNIASTAVSSLSDGDDVVMETDTFIIDGGDSGAV